MNKISIMMHGQLGDIASAMSVLKYKEELWGSDCKVTWFASKENFDVFKHSDIDVREFPRGFGYPEMVVEENRKLIELGKEPVWEDWSGLVDENNHLNLELAKNVPSLAEFHFGYFPAPHQVPVDKRHNVTYPNVSKKIFGVHDDWEWHPCLEFSEEDYDKVDLFLAKLVKRKTVFAETFAGSGQSLLDEEMIAKTMSLCNEYWGECNFVFASHKFLRSNETFPAYLFEQPNVYSCKDFTVRQCALIAGSSDIIISVSSGITVAASCWYNRPTPIIQFCGSEICSTKGIALGKFELVTADERSLNTAKEQFYSKLKMMLNE